MTTASAVSAGHVDHLWSAEDAPLIRAVCQTGADAVKAWSQWRSRVRLDDVTLASALLLPAIARRPDLLESDPDAGRLRGIYRRAWVANTLLLEQVSPALEALAAGGVEFARTGPAEVLRLHRRDPGERPLDRVDVLVRPAQRQTAEKVMERLGWSVGEVCSTPAGGRLRLCGHLVRASTGRHSDAAAWRDSTADGPGRRLASADLLLDILLCAAPGPAWVVDVHALLCSITAAGDDHSLAVFCRRVRAHGVLRSARERLVLIADATGNPEYSGLLDRERRGSVEILRDITASAPKTRPSRAVGQLLAHSAGSGLVAGARSLIRDRLDLDRSQRPLVATALAATGRVPALARIARRRGPLSSARPSALMQPEDVIDLANPAVFMEHAGPGWREAGASGAVSKGTEARLVLWLECAGTVELEFAADGSSPVTISVNDRAVASTPGRGGPALVRVEAPAGVCELAFRTGVRRRLLLPGYLFVVLRSAALV